MRQRATFGSRPVGIAQRLGLGAVAPSFVAGTPVATAGARPSPREDVSQFSDTSLVVCLSRGRRGAFREVCTRHAGEMHELAAKVCGHTEAREVVAAVLLSLWAEPHLVDPERTSLRTFLLARVHAQAVETVRQAQEGLSTAPDGQATARPDMSPAVLAARVGQPAWQLLSSLPDEERDAIALAYFCGYGYRQSAELTEQPPEVVARRIRSGLIALGA